jgi:enoyl-CoA hydratase
MIDLQVADGTAMVTIRRPERRNALDADHWIQLSVILDEIAESDVDGIIITGTDSVFAAGADIQQLADRQPLDALNGVAQNTLRCLEKLPFVSVAAINGHALGGGCEIALACDMRIAVPAAKIGLPEVGLGIIPGAGGTQRLPRVVGYAKALEMIITGQPVSGEEALRIGLVNRIAQPESLLSEARELVATVGQQGRVAVSLVRQVLQVGNSNIELGMLLERLASATVYTSDERKFRMQKFLAKRQKGKG